MSGCMNAGRPGCHGKLCRAAHFSLRQLPTVRYPIGDNGLSDTAAEPETGWVCGLISRKGVSRGSLDVPGFTGGQRPMYLIAAAGSLEPPVAAGDLITVNGTAHRVLTVSMSEQLTAELIAEEG